MTYIKGQCLAGVLQRKRPGIAFQGAFVAMSRQSKTILLVGKIAVFGLFLGVSQTFAQGMRITDGDVHLPKVEAEKPVSEPATAVKPVSRKVKRSFLGLPVAKPAVQNPQPVQLVKLTAARGDRPAQVLKDAVYREAARYGIDPDLIFSLIWQESRFKLGAVSPKNARGPMQMIPETAARFGARNPHDPDQAVKAGVAYLAWLLDRFRGNVSLALAGYNAGEMAVEAYLEGKTIVLRNGKVINRRSIATGGIPPYNETQNYVKRIADRYRMVKNLPR